MLPLNPLLSLTPLRVQRGVARLQELIWSDAEPVRVEATTSQAQPIPLDAARTRPRRPVPPGQAWGRLYDQRWCRVTIPAGAKGRWLRWDEQGEATLFIDGTPYFGFDVAHRHCLLPAGTRDAWVEGLCVQAAIWHPDAKGLSYEGNLFRGAWTVRRDDEAWNAYHDLNCLYDWLLELRSREHPGVARELFSMAQQPLLTDVSPLYRRFLRAMDLALDAFDQDGVSALRRALAGVYREFRDPKPFARAALTGHSHLDLVWLWPERIGEGKAVHTFANANRLMAQYPEFRFAYSQPLSYEAVGRRAPSLLRAVKSRIRSGQWEATGGMYVESDSHVPCGEGLVRAFTLGQQGFTQLSGRRSRVLWLPDLFGFSACLPQLMKLSGVDYFFTTKTTWNTLNRFPHSSFVWRGPGGHAVVSHVTQGVQFNNALTIEQLRATAHQNQQGDIFPETLMPNGWGDGGGGPSDDMCERARRLTALRGLPELRWDQPEAFFDRLAETRANLPTLDGEIYLEYHRGTFTTQSRVKSHFRALERALQAREAALVVSGGTPDAALDHAWRRMVFAQFHDFIPGSSIPEVYAEGLPELAQLTRAQSASAKESLTKMRAAVHTACVFNTLPVPRRAVVNGRVLDLPALAGVTVAEAAVRDVTPVNVAGRTLDNGRVRARIAADGTLAALSVDGREVELLAGAAEFTTYPEQSSNFGPWDIDRHALSLGERVRTPAKVTPDQTGISVSRRIGQASTSTTRFWLEPGANVLRVTVTLDWHETDTMLKLRFPTAYRGREARCGTPFGSVLRPQLSTSPLVEGMWEWPMSRWASVSSDGERAGLFIAAESKYGVSCRDGVLALTLLRSSRHVGFEEHGKTYPVHLSRLPQPTTFFTDQGEHVINFALGFFDLAAPRAEQPAVLAETTFTAPIPYQGAPQASAFGGVVGADTLIPHWAQPLGRNRWVLRLHEIAGRHGTAQLLLADGWSARKIDLLGQPMGSALKNGRLPYATYEIISLEISKVR